MSRMVREVLEQSKSGRNCNYTEIHLEIEVLKRVFGPRVFDQIRKAWIEDDHDVVWVRAIGEKEAEQLRSHLGEIDFHFDFSANEYFLVTSEDKNAA